MFQFALEAVLFQLRARWPSFRPLLQLPNRRATPRGDVCSLPCYLFVSRTEPINLLLLGELRYAYPQTPYAATPTGGKRRSAAEMCQSAREAVSFQERARWPTARP